MSRYSILYLKFLLYYTFFCFIYLFFCFVFLAYMTGSVFHALSRRVIGDPSHFSMWLQKGARNWVDNMLIRNDGVGSLFFLDDKNPLSVTSKLFGKNKV